MESNTKDICKNKLVDLGEIIDMLRNGQKLSSEQLMLLENATPKQKELAFMMRAAATLKGQEYTNYCHNARILSRKK